MHGRNNKGLVTFDRKIKKDAFFLYKAYWSDEPFVHMAGARYLKRLIGTTEIKVYSNMSEVEIEVNGEKRVLSGKAVFRFEDVPVKPGENTVIVRAGGLEERAVIEGVETEPEEYRLPEGAGSFVRNWFASGTDEIDPTRFSTEDKIRDLVANPEVQALIKKFVGNKVPRFLISLVKPFRVKTLLKLPFVKLDEQMISMVDRYLQTIKK